MIPKYAFQVAVDYNHAGAIRRESKNYESLQGAHAYAAMTIRKSNVRRVRVSIVIEELSKNESGGVVELLQTG